MLIENEEFYQTPKAHVVYEIFKSLIPKGANPLDIVFEVNKDALDIDVIVFVNNFPTNLGKVWAASTPAALYEGRLYCAFYLNAYAFARELPTTVVNGIDFTNNL